MNTGGSQWITMDPDISQLMQMNQDGSRRIRMDPNGFK